jgi:hypothetical protein
MPEDVVLCVSEAMGVRLLLLDSKDHNAFEAYTISWLQVVRFISTLSSWI